MTLKPLVNDYNLYQAFLSYIKEKLIYTRSQLEQASDPMAIYRLQGQIIAYKKLLNLREEING